MAQAPNNRSAFTLIELMVVVAIVAILASFGMPAYQDYIRKTRVAEALQLVNGIKTQIAENAFQGRPYNEGLTLPSLTPYLQSITVASGDGLINLTFNPAKFNGNPYTILLIPKDGGFSGTLRNNLYGDATSSTIPEGGIIWGCRSAGTTGWTQPTNPMPAKYVPEVCKGNPYN